MSAHEIHMPHRAQPETEPDPRHAYRAGGGLMLIAGFVAAIFLTTAVHKGSSSVQGAVVTASLVFIIIGLVVAAAAWVAWRNAKQTRELVHQHALTQESLAVLAEAVKEIAAMHPVSLDDMRKMVEEQAADWLQRALAGQLMIATKFRDPGTPTQAVDDIREQVKELMRWREEMSSPDVVSLSALRAIKSLDEQINPNAHR